LLNALLYGQKSNLSDALARPVNGPAPRFVRAVEDYIRQNYAEALTIEKLAAVAGVSARALFAGFRDFRDTTPMVFVRKVRLDKARQALREAEPCGSAGVTKIALDCGFSHLGRFAALYRAQFGELPSATGRSKPIGRP
jgi:AraC-like DNA-binding protein